MTTHQLVRRLVSDLETQTSAASRPLTPRLTLMTVLASMVSLAAILLLLSRSPHLAHGPTPTVLFTALTGAALASGAFWAALKLSYPEGQVRLLWLGLPLAILLTGLGLELSQAPRASWSSRLWGDNPLACYLWVTALSLPILAAVLVALRDGAPSYPRLCGAMAGLIAGGIATALYTIHCPENSLLFIASWHVLAVLTVALAGTVAGGRCLRW